MTKSEFNSLLEHKCNTTLAAFGFKKNEIHYYSLSYNFDHAIAEWVEIL